MDLDNSLILFSEGIGMITWALVWLFSQSESVSGLLVLLCLMFSVMGDVGIFFFIACAFRGFPK